MTVPLDDLNAAQRRAVMTLEGPLLILAGAGSGKTRVITRRIAWLLEQGVKPWEIFAVTFTNKAAQEMKERVEALVGDVARRILVSTFHAACMRFLRQDIPLVGYPKTFTIYDDDDQTRLLKAICADLHIDPERYPPGRFRYGIDQAKNQLLSPEQLAAEPWRIGRKVDLTDPTPKVYAEYQRRLRQQSAVDFNDILGLMVQILEEFPEVRARYQARYRFLMVDEYQDTNAAQYRLIRLLAGEGRPNLAVVGDDDQSIYRVRGADIGNILNFDRDYPDAKIVLPTNYRSTRRIFDAAMSVVRNNSRRLPGKDDIQAAGDEGEPVRLLTGESEQDEAALVLKEIRWLLQRGYRPGDIAVIYRTNAASRAFEQVLTSASIPFALVGGQRFFNREEVKDILSYLRLVLNPADEMSFLRAIGAPARGVGPKALDAIRAEAEARGVPLLSALGVWAEGGGKSRAGGAAFYKLIRHLQELALTESPVRVVMATIEESGYARALRAEDSDKARARIENLDALVHAVQEAQDAGREPEGDTDLPTPQEPLEVLQAFLDRAALSGGSDDLPDEDGRVTLLTAHLAKGLEYPVVFVAGLYQGGFPHFRSLDFEDDLEEERRLLYVACTRARARLYLSRPRTRMTFDAKNGARLQRADPSLFLSEMDPRVLSYGSASVAALPRPSPPAPTPPTLSGSRFASLQRPLPGLSAPRPPTAPAPSGEVHRTLIPDSAASFQVGVRVVHPQFGPGVIQERLGSPSNPKLVIQFDRLGRRTVIALQARLEILIS